jgi:hypothetical protein
MIGAENDLIQCFSKCGPRLFRKKIITKIVSVTEGMINTPIQVCAKKLPLVVDLQQKVGKLVLSITACPSVIILENT